MVLDPDADEEPDPEADDDSDIDPEAEADDEPDTEPEAEADDDPDIDPEAEADDEPDTEPEAEADDDPDIDPEAETDEEPDPDAESSSAAPTLDIVPIPATAAETPAIPLMTVRLFDAELPPGSNSSLVRSPDTSSSLLSELRVMVEYKATDFRFLRPQFLIPYGAF